MASPAIIARLGLDSKKFQTGLAAARNRLNSFVSGAAGRIAALAGVGGFGMLSKSAIDLGSRMSDLAEQTNTTVAEFMTLRAVSRDAGVSQDTLARALRNVNNRVVEATRGNKSYQEALTELGLDAEELAKIPVAERFELIAKAVNTAEDRTRAMAIASRILGERAGPELNEVLKRTSDEGLQQLIDKAREAGEILESDTANRLDKAADAIERFKDRATIRVGEIIAGEADFAAAKILGFQLLKAANKFAEFFIKIPIRFGVLLKSVFGEAGSQLADRFEIIGQSLKVALLTAVDAVLQRIPGVSQEMKDAFGGAVTGNTSLLEAMTRKANEDPGFIPGVKQRYGDDMELINRFLDDNPLFGGAREEIDKTIEALNGQIEAERAANEAERELEKKKEETAKLEAKNAEEEAKILEEEKKADEAEEEAKSLEEEKKADDTKWFGGGGGGTATTFRSGPGFEEDENADMTVEEIRQAANRRGEETGRRFRRESRVSGGERVAGFQILEDGRVVGSISAEELRKRLEEERRSASGGGGGGGDGKGEKDPFADMAAGIKSIDERLSRLEDNLS